MDGAAIPPSSDFARSVEDWDSPAVPSHADEPKQARHTTPNVVLPPSGTARSQVDQGEETRITKN